jgi:ferredoxin-type protein NapH
MKIRQRMRRAAMIGAVALFPITLYYFSPVLPLQGLASGIVTGSILVFALLFLSSLPLGRGFCAWVCPAGGVQEIVRGFKGPAVNRIRINWLKWVIWGPWALALVFTAFRAGGVRSVDLTYQTWHGVSAAGMPGLIAFVSVTALFAVLALSVGRRAACHTICWMAPFMILGRKVRNLFAWPSLRLSARAGSCRGCGACTKHCPMSIDVQAMVKAGDIENPDCILCASCADACPQETIRLTFSSGH